MIDRLTEPHRIVSIVSEFGRRSSVSVHLHRVQTVYGLRRLTARVRARVLLHVSLRLPQLPCEAARQLDPVAGHHHAVTGSAPAGMLTIPKRLRAYCLYRRRLLGEIARVAARTLLYEWAYDQA